MSEEHTISFFIWKENAKSYDSIDLLDYVNVMRCYAWWIWFQPEWSPWVDLLYTYAKYV